MMKILIFNLAEDKRKALLEIGKKQKIQIVDVKKADCSQQIGYLAGIQGFTKKIGGSQGMSPLMLGAEMMIFCGMTSGQLDHFLDAYKESQLPPVAIKAAVTPTNIFWTPVQLFAEAGREHQVMTMSTQSTDRINNTKITS